MSRRILSVALACLLTAILLPAQTTSLGVVTQSSLGHLNSGDASVGTTIYDGDRLDTATKGALSVRSGNVQLVLAEDSDLMMNHDGSDLTPTLQRGTVAFRVESGGGLRITAADVRVRPRSAALTAGQVTLERCAVLVTSRVQALEVTAGKEIKIVEEGKSYRVALEGPCAAAQNRAAPIAGAHSRFLVVPALFGAVAVLAVQEALESPDRP